jgi:hypothetical protein
MRGDRLRNWSAAASSWLEAAVGGAVTAATLALEWGQRPHAGAGPHAALAAAAVLIGVALTWRRRAPLAVLTVVLVAVLGSGAPP